MNNKELTEVGKQVTKRKRPDLSESQTVHTEPGDNRKYILHSLRLAELPKLNLTSVEEVTQRIKDYFTICAEDDMKPSVAGLALAMDIDRSYLWEIRSGRKGKNPEVANTLKKAMKILDLQMVDYMQNGKINPVSGIFLMKNNFGYADKQEVVLTPNNPLGDTKDTKELEERYIDSVVDD
nr:MAG TPA: Terminase small subunit [Caudoviricetes sp.]